MISSKVFITGAAGFIGGRIAERLWLDHRVAARCLVRNFSKAARLARLPVAMCPGDLLDRSSLEKAMGNSRIVFNCAYGKTADPVMNRRIEEEGLRNLGELALHRGAEKFIHLSTVALYGPEPPDIITEETPVRTSPDEYGNNKIRAEAICRELSERGLPVVIIRPTVVFGPFSPLWTIGTVKRVLSGGWDDTDGITGLCNPVYIDDLVNGIFLCAEKDTAPGQTFILSGPDPISWREYIQAYKDAAGGNVAPVPGNGGPAWRKGLSRVLGPNLRFLRKFLEPQMIEFYERMKIVNPELARKLYSLFKGGAQDDEKLKFSRRSVYSIEKAKSLLGYAPRSFADGMKETVEWLRYYEYI